MKGFLRKGFWERKSGKPSETAGKWLFRGYLKPRKKQKQNKNNQNKNKC